jgi:hypothetical protein
MAIKVKRQVLSTAKKTKLNEFLYGKVDIHTGGYSDPTWNDHRVAAEVSSDFFCSLQNVRSARKRCVEEILANQARLERQARQAQSQPQAQSLSAAATPPEEPAAATPPSTSPIDEAFAKVLERLDTMEKSINETQAAVVEIRTAVGEVKAIFESLRSRIDDTKTAVTDGIESVRVAVGHTLETLSEGFVAALRTKKDKK